MSSRHQSEFKNKFLLRLSSEDFALIAGDIEPFDCRLGQTLIVPGEPMTSVFFFESGIASVVVIGSSGTEVEGGVIGVEGFVPPEAAIGADKIVQRVEVQLEGTGHRVGILAFQKALANSDTFRDIALRFLRVMIVQNAYTVLSNSTNAVSERLGRWLLMCDDRSEANDLHLTHKFLAVMLAVRRASVTEAIQYLEGKGLIYSDRKYLAIRDRAALEAYVGDAYGTPEAEYRRLLGPI
jgi:CRP-like cAMP-binding protein